MPRKIPFRARRSHSGDHQRRAPSASGGRSHALATKASLLREEGRRAELPSRGWDVGCEHRRRRHQDRHRLHHAMHDWRHRDRLTMIGAKRRDAGHGRRTNSRRRTRAGAHVCGRARIRHRVGGRVRGRHAGHVRHARHVSRCVCAHHPCHGLHARYNAHDSARHHCQVTGEQGQEKARGATHASEH